jgi:hypothetical protein
MLASNLVEASRVPPSLRPASMPLGPPSALPSSVPDAHAEIKISAKTTRMRRSYRL